MWLSSSRELALLFYLTLATLGFGGASTPPSTTADANRLETATSTTLLGVHRRPTIAPCVSIDYNGEERLKMRREEVLG